MTLPTRAAAHAAVLGAAVLAVSLWPVHSALSAADSSALRSTAATPRTPAVAVTATPAMRPVARPSRRPARRHVTRHPSPRAASGASTRGVTRRPAPSHPAPAPAAPRTVRQWPAVVVATGWSALDAAISRIPSYHAGAARWVVSGRYGHWGATDWYHGVIYIGPNVPTGYLYSVAAHEWSHELSVLDYGGNVDAAVRAMDRYFGGSGLVGAERAADCMAILQGATWTDYTGCRSPRWRAGAARLVHGGRL